MKEKLIYGAFVGGKYFIGALLLIFCWSLAAIFATFLVSWLISVDYAVITAMGYAFGACGVSFLVLGVLLFVGMGIAAMYSIVTGEEVL